MAPVTWPVDLSGDRRLHSLRNRSSVCQKALYGLHQAKPFIRTGNSFTTYGDEALGKDLKPLPSAAKYHELVTDGPDLQGLQGSESSSERAIYNSDILIPIFHVSLKLDKSLSRL